MLKRHVPNTQFVLALGFSTLVSTGLLAYSAWRNHSLAYDYLLWNLFLAWLPLAFAFRLVRVLRSKLWSSWEALGTTLVWLAFLPNSFYMISDFIHLQDVRQVDVLYDAVMFTSFIYTGVILGFASLYLIHLQLKRRLSDRTAAGLIAATLLTCGTAVYIGRDLRWNSWDILTNPGGLVFDMSDRLMHPSAYPQLITTTVIFFVLLSSMYNLVWRGVQLMRTSKPLQP